MVLTKFKEKNGMYNEEWTMSLSTTSSILIKVAS
jgi:hypothetical protein